MKKDKFYFSEGDLRRFIKKSHLKAVWKFKEELEAFRKETGDEAATLCENANISFTLANIAVSSDGQLFYDYDGKTEFEVIVRKDDETGEYYEDDGKDGIMEYVKFWRSCLRRAKRYWSMGSDELDKLQDGETEDDEEEED